MVQSKGFLSIVCLARTLVQCKLALAHSFGKMLPFMTSSTFALLGSGEESLGDAEQREGPERMPGSRRGREEPAGSEIEEQTKEAEEGREAN